MESSLLHSDITMSGNSSSGNLYLFCDMFNLFAGSFAELISHFEPDNQILFYSDSGFSEVDDKRKLRHKSLAGYADDLITYLESRSISNATFIAHSVNGLVALMVAAKAPHLFSQLVLTSAFSSLQPDAETLYLCGLQAHDANSLFDHLMNKKDTGNYHQPSNQGIPQLTHILREAFITMDSENAKALFLLLLSADCRSYLSDLSVPVVILQGLSDRISTNEAGYSMYRTIPNSQLVRIRAKGHLPQVDAPLEIVQAMKFFVTPSF